MVVPSTNRICATCTRSLAATEFDIEPARMVNGRRVAEHYSASCSRCKVVLKLKKVKAEYASLTGMLERKIEKIDQRREEAKAREREVLEREERAFG